MIGYDQGNDNGERLKLRRKDIREYKVKELPYHFVLFYNIPESQANSIKKSLGGRDEDNALLTYCYLDSIAGLSYKAICWAKLNENGRVEYNEPETVDTALTIRESGLLCSAEIINENAAGMDRFQEKVEFIKECYGYHADRIDIDDDIPFDEYRHPGYPNDILVKFFSPDKKLEEMWVREVSRDGEFIRGTLLNEPYNSLIGLHEGDIVAVIPQKTDDGKIFPMALLPWMIKDT